MEFIGNNTPTGGAPSTSPPTSMGIDPESSFRALIPVVNSEPLSSPARDKSKGNELEAITGEDERGQDSGLRTASSSYNTGGPRPFSRSGSDDHLRFRCKSRNNNRKKKPSNNSNRTLESLGQRSSPKRAAQHFPPTKWSREDSSRLRSLTHLPIDPVDTGPTDLWVSPMSRSPSAQLQDPLRSSEELCAEGLQEVPGSHESPRDQPATPYAWPPPALTPPNDSKNPPPSRNKKTQKQSVKARPGSKARKISIYFPISKAAADSSLPFPNTRRKRFGLIQETVAHDPFRLLVATIFLNKTKGEAANPIFKKVFEEFSTVESLANADVDKLASTIQPLGLHNQRARKVINLAKTWLSEPPTKGKRYRRLGYPKQHDGRDVKADECLDDDDPRFAWEVAHLPGIGPYAIDSWRIFCRDKLRGLATDYKGTEAAEGFVPEWKSVLPHDKELRAYLSWMWLKEGYSWDMETGELTPADPKPKRAASKNNLYIAKDESELSTKPGRAIVEDLYTLAPPHGFGT